LRISVSEMGTRDAYVFCSTNGVQINWIVPVPVYRVRGRTV
jgi:hypothetical protein